MSFAYRNQIQNRNFLSTVVGFKFTLSKDPKISFSATLQEYQKSV